MIYYHITFWQRCGNRYGGSGVYYEPVTFVSDRHPFEWVDEWKKRKIENRVITNWIEITKLEYDQFRQIINR